MAGAFYSHIYTFQHSYYGCLINRYENQLHSYEVRNVIQGRFLTVVSR